MNWNGLESPSIESERLVQVSLLCESSILSMAGHEENPEQGSEIEPETIRLQPVGAASCCDGVPIE